MESNQHPSLQEARPTSESILVVDDDTEVLQMIQWVLEDEGFDVQTAADGREALSQARQRRPALVILDMGLPLLNGSRVAAELHILYETAIPIVLITADGQTARKSRQIGASAFLRKPFDITELVQVVQHILAET